MTSYAFGDGSVEVADDGSVVAVTHPDGVRPMLLQEAPDQVESSMHDAGRRWGKGFVITDRGSHRWNTPASLELQPDGVDLAYTLGDLALRVSRRFGATWSESYALINHGAGPIDIGSLAISTPFRDVYGSSRDCLHRAVHAHVWAGGDDAWVWAEPMNGARPVLGLTMTEGGIWAYSVESRDQFTSSNVRGHIYLHATDLARAPHAMGGQPRITLAPGETYRLAWRLRWYVDHGDFVHDRNALATAPVVSAAVGESIMVSAAPGVKLSDPSPVTGATAGEKSIIAEWDGRRSRTDLIFHVPLSDLVEARIRFALDRQRPVEEPGSRSAAFVPYDTASGLRVLSGSWRDWNDVRERVGTAIMLQQARDHGLGDRAELDSALSAYEGFVREHVLTADGTILDDVRHDENRLRLYNFPWFARFLLSQGDLDAAVSILDRYYGLGGDHFLAFDLGPLLRDCAQALTDLGRHEDAVRMEAHLLGHAAAMIDHGDDLPAHEVNYEQSMVAPLVELLLNAHQVDPAAVPGEEVLRRLPWLAAFGSDQPDGRLRHVPIRHWDGYWFGTLRLWGDTFPHYWTVLNAAVYLAWPKSLGGPDLVAELRRRGEAILRSNLANFHADGSATCAFVYPSAVNGRPAHVADPLINDQDWALVYAMRYGWDLIGAATSS